MDAVDCRVFGDGSDVESGHRPPALPAVVSLRILGNRPFPLPFLSVIWRENPAPSGRCSPRSTSRRSPAGPRLRAEVRRHPRARRTCRRRRGRVAAHLYSRNGNEKTRSSRRSRGARTLAGAAARRPLLLDGEIVASTATAGRSASSTSRDASTSPPPRTSSAPSARSRPRSSLFDLLRDGDEDLRGQPLAARRLRLQERVPAATRRRRCVASARSR